MVAPNTSNTGPNPGDTNTTATTQTPVVEVFGTPGDGKVPTWNATTQRFEWGSGSSASLPSATSGDAGKVVTVGSDGSYELGAGGSSTPGAMRCIAVDFAFDSPGIQDPATGFVVYTPAVGEVILDDVKYTSVQIITPFDGTTPQLDAGVQSAGAWVGSGNFIDPTVPAGTPTGSIGTADNGLGFTNAPVDVQTGTDALAIRLSDSFGNASGSTVGAGRLYLFVALPTNPT